MRAIVDLTESVLPPEVEPDEPGEPPESDPEGERLAHAASPVMPRALARRITATPAQTIRLSWLG